MSDTLTQTPGETPAGAGGTPALPEEKTVTEYLTRLKFGTGEFVLGAKTVQDLEDIHALLFQPFFGSRLRPLDLRKVYLRECTKVQSLT